VRRILARVRSVPSDAGQAYPDLIVSLLIVVLLVAIFLKVYGVV
jgi:hypothetical protein